MTPWIDRRLCILFFALAGSLRAEPAWISGSVDVGGLDNQFNRPLRVLLLDELDPEGRALMEAQVRSFNEVYQATGQIAEPALAPEYKPVLQAFVDAALERLPEATHALFQADGGRIGVRTDPRLVESFRASLRAMPLPNLSNELGALHKTCADLLLKHTLVVHAGYQGRTEGFELFGLSTQAKEGDMSDARRVAQATINGQWLFEVDRFLLDLRDELAALELPEVDSPLARWNRFQLRQAGDLAFQVDLRTIRETGIANGGQFQTYGEGLVVFAMPCYGQTVFFPESSPEALVRVRRSETN